MHSTIDNQIEDVSIPLYVLIRTASFISPLRYTNSKQYQTHLTDHLMHISFEDYNNREVILVPAQLCRRRASGTKRALCFGGLALSGTDFYDAIKGVPARSARHFRTSQSADGDGSRYVSCCRPFAQVLLLEEAAERKLA